jgi:hypothetical protein
LDPLCGTTASRAGAFFPEGVAGGFNLKADAAGAESVVLCDDRFADIKAVIVEFYDFSAVDTDEVTMSRVFGKIGVVEGGGLAEIDLTKESCANKKSESAIDGGTGNFRVLATRASEKGFSTKVLSVTKGDFGDRFALGSKA